MQFDVGVKAPKFKPCRRERPMEAEQNLCVMLLSHNPNQGDTGQGRGWRSRGLVSPSEEMVTSESEKKKSVGSWRRGHQDRSMFKVSVPNKGCAS